MYQGKYNHSENNGRYTEHRSHGRKRSLLVLVSVFVLTFAMVGGTLAYLAAKTEPVENKFTFGGVPIEIPEKFENGVKENVRVHNDGPADAFVRAKIVVTWKSASGEVSGTAVQPRDYTLTTGNGWFQGTDGFWYCKNRVEAKTDSEVLITKATKKDGVVPPEGFDLSIEILAQSVQADGEFTAGEPMVEHFWPVTATPNGQHPQTIAAK